MKVRAIITGATGMVGEGVLLECLEDPTVEQVLIVNRRPCGISHAKLKEVIHEDFFNLRPIEGQLVGYNACFFCLGTSSVGLSTEDYKHVTYDLTLSFGRTLAKLNPDLTFCYVTGSGTDSTETGRVAWARIKGATENELLRQFTKAYMFRPGFIKASPRQKNIKTFYKYIEWIYPLGRALFPGGFCTVKELGQAMIRAASGDGPTQILEVKDIVELARI